MARRPVLAVLALMAVLIVVALPVVAADPSSNPAGSGEVQASPDAGGQAAKPDKSPKPEKRDKTPITVTGTVGTGTDSDGDPSYTMVSGGTTYTLDGGPSWFYGDNHPLKPFVGQSVTVSGEMEVGSTDIDVKTVNGTAIRAPGKPPWAGGWKRVGERHPGWTQEKADRFKAKFGDCFPPGQCKDKPNKAAQPAESALPGS